jgi:triacylglycerol lipase
MTMTTNKHYPLILAHGITRPDYLIDFIMRKLKLYDFSLVADRFHYFKGIASYLRKNGVEVYHTNVSFAADVETRAKDLTREIQKILDTTGHAKVHIIGHSMGGLDARHMIVHEGMADKVATLTTIGTPHLGSPVADWVLENGLDKLVEALREVINLEGARSLTPGACREFNAFARSAEACNAVIYQTYASSQKRESTFLPFQRTWQIVYEKEGDNDGLVSVPSQKWAERLVGKEGTIKFIKQHHFPLPADHINQMGWWHFERKPEWWNWGLFKEKKQYETIIKNIYLKIAHEVNFLIESGDHTTPESMRRMAA